MTLDIDAEIAVMEQMSVQELRELHAEVFDEATTSRHRRFLIRRIAWRLQVNAMGGLTPQAQKRAQELANEADIRRHAPVTPSAVAARRGGSRERTVTRGLPSATCANDNIPPVGCELTRDYKGQRIVVTICDNGVRWKGKLYASLTAVANEVTGSHWNGRAFFRLNEGKN